MKKAERIPHTPQFWSVTARLSDPNHKNLLNAYVDQLNEN
jgi:hypothetical protein